MGSVVGLDGKGRDGLGLGWDGGMWGGEGLGWEGWVGIGMDGHSMARHERLYAWVVQGSTVPGRTGEPDNRADSRDHDGRWYLLSLPWDLGQSGGWRWGFEVGAGPVLSG